MKGILFCDVDGTLVNYGDERATPGVLDALHQAIRAGWVVCVTTGREYESARLTFPSLEQEAYFCCSSGACLFYHGREVISPICLDWKTIDEVVEVAKMYHCSILFSVPDGIYTLGSLLPATSDLLKQQHTEPKPIEDVSQLPPGRVCECTYQFPEGAEIPLNVLNGRWPGKIFWAMGGPGMVDGALADKGMGVRRVLEHLGISKEDAYAFGDFDNDIPMLQAVGHGYVMAHTKRREMLEWFPLHCDDLETTIRLITG